MRKLEEKCRYCSSRRTYTVIVLFIISLLILFLFSCATCPPENVVIRIMPENTPLMIPRGLLDEKNHGKCWITEKEFRELNRIIKESEKLNKELEKI